MAQQVFDQYVPVARFGPNPQDTIPVVAAIAQTRDGKDELLLGNVPFVPGPGGLYVPVSAANRLPVEATLSGSVVTLATHDDDVVIPAGNSYSMAVITPLGNNYRAVRVAAVFDVDIPWRIEMRQYAAGTTTPILWVDSVYSTQDGRWAWAEFNVWGTGRMQVLVHNLSANPATLRKGEILGVR